VKTVTALLRSSTRACSALLKEVTCQSVVIIADRRRFLQTFLFRLLPVLKHYVLLSRRYIHRVLKLDISEVRLFVSIREHIMFGLDQFDVLRV